MKKFGLVLFKVFVSFETMHVNFGNCTSKVSNKKFAIILNSFKKEKERNENSSNLC